MMLGKFLELLKKSSPSPKPLLNIFLKGYFGGDFFEKYFVSFKNLLTQSKKSKKS